MSDQDRDGRSGSNITGLAILLAAAGGVGTYATSKSGDPFAFITVGAATLFALFFAVAMIWADLSDDDD